MLGVCWEEDVGVVTTEEPAECWIDDDPTTKEDDEVLEVMEGLAAPAGGADELATAVCFPVKLARETLELSGMLLGTLNRVQSWT